VTASRPRVLMAKFAENFVDRRTDPYFWLRDDSRRASTTVLSSTTTVNPPNAFNWSQSRSWGCLYTTPSCTAPCCRKDPEILAHLMEENNYTAAVMAPTQDLQDALYAEMKGRIPPEETYPPQVRTLHLASLVCS
jgi:protease II